jgi:peptide/nickel transport system permease protein
VKFAKYVARRILQMIPVILAVVVINFLIIHLAPGDPVTVMAGEDATDEYINYLRVQFGLNKPLYQQLILYIGNVLKGNLGTSYSYQRPVMMLLLDKMQVTLVLVLLSQIVAIVLGTLLGMVAARHEGKFTDNLISNTSMVLYCMPVFWLGMMLILFFAVKLRLLPSSGMYSYNAKNYSQSVDLLLHLIMPSIALTLVNLPTYIKLSRSSVVEVAQEDFVNTARAIGYPESVVYKKHALRNALLPTVTQAGMSLSTVFSGALLTETVFSWPGMGRMVYDAISKRDYPVIMGGFLVTAIMVVIGSFITDIIYMYLDPRVVHK